jgi:uncharacterized protein (TIGR04255 family)
VLNLGIRKADDGAQKLYPLLDGGARVPLRLELQRRRVYKNNPLKVVICQVRFPVLTRFEQPGFVAPFEEAVRERFPRVHQEQQVLFSVAAGPPSPPALSPSWRFQTTDGSTSALLARDALTLETTTYSRFEEFLSLVSLLVGALAGVDVNVRERLGLRYVNEIRHPDAQIASAWANFINPAMLGTVGGELLGDDVIHALENIRLREEDATVVITHGFVGKDAVPSDGEPFYQLDIDFGDGRAVEFDSEATLEQVTGFHDRISDLFEMSISDAMREHLVVLEEIDG